LCICRTGSNQRTCAYDDPLVVLLSKKTTTLKATSFSDIFRRIVTIIELKKNIKVETVVKIPNKKQLFVNKS
jgi:vesicle coat complex subunit